ncbi:hypothetical protein BGZ99_010111 [Dissophora globulifera]|uniref:CREG-like beta-barrel domain-containing protein n=1 Tax=Dissophora globulifera TaxID=979702 RepID=A0A9P6R750_9FUNG|nr:hypothetical protein BGZ99_010111 [Dissophora globulifera]
MHTLALAVLFTLSHSAVLALPSISSCGGERVTAVGETHDQAARLARNLVKNTGIGTFMSVMNADRNDGILEGYPFGSMDYYADDCESPGTPLMLLSDLQVNVRNAKTDNRVSLAIRRLPGRNENTSPMAEPRVTLLGHLVPVAKDKYANAEACFLAQHPNVGWLPGSGFHDFKWYHLEIKDIYYIGGFGGIHYIGWIDTETYHSKEQPQFRAQ